MQSEMLQDADTGLEENELDAHNYERGSTGRGWGFTSVQKKPEFLDKSSKKIDILQVFLVPK